MTLKVSHINGFEDGGTFASASGSFDGVFIFTKKRCTSAANSSMLTVLDSPSPCLSAATRTRSCDRMNSKRGRVSTPWTQYVVGS